jgi:aldose 1-epimerase
MTEIHELTCGAARLRIAPALGGRITALKLDAGAGAGATSILFPFPEDAHCLLPWPKGGIYPLAPYANRVRNGVVQGRQLRPHPDVAPDTLHGPAHRDAWATTSIITNTAMLALDRAADDEWPWHIKANLAISLVSPARAEIAIGLRNADRSPMPAGLGLHPYFLHDPQGTIGVRAPTFWPATSRGFAGEPLSDALPLDGPLPPGDVTLYRSDWDGAATFALPGGRRVAIRLLSGPLRHLIIHRPGAAPYLCLEPVSHVVDAFNRADDSADNGARMLNPGEELRGAIAIELLHDSRDRMWSMEPVNSLAEN